MNQIINVGTIPNDGTGDKLRDAFIIVNDNFASIDTLLSGNDVLTISQITGLQTALNNINSQLGYIPGLQSDINSINNTIYTINQTLNTQSASIADLYTEITDLQNQIYSKIEEAPIDGTPYVRQDAGWVASTGGGIPEAPIDGTLYARQNGNWTGFTTGIGDAPVDGNQYVRKNGSWSVGGVGEMIDDGSSLNLNNFYTGILSGYNQSTLDIVSMYPGYIKLCSANTNTKPFMELRKEGILFRNGTSSVATQSLIGNSLTYTTGQTFSLPNKNVAGIYNLLTYDLGTSGTTLDYLQFTGLTNSGRLSWNDTDGTMDLTLKGGNVTLQVGQEQLVRVVNKTAINITLLESNYQAVRITGAQGQRLKVDLALADNDLDSATTIGLVTETILNNQEGFVTISGLVNKINTTGSLQGETWLDGDTLYLSPSTAGNITNIKPSAPDHLVIIGYVVYSHSVNGKIFVKVDNGYELDELHNVKITGATAGQVLQFGTSSIWQNKTLPTIEEQIGFKPFKWVLTSQTLHTGTLSETILGTAIITGGTFNVDDVMKVLCRYTKVTSTNTMALRMKINTTNTLSGATQIATYTFAAANTFGVFSRTFDLNGGNIYGYNQASSVANDVTPTNTVGSSNTYTTTSDLYFFFTVQLNNIVDSVRPNLQNITN